MWEQVFPIRPIEDTRGCAASDGDRELERGLTVHVVRSKSTNLSSRRPRHAQARNKAGFLYQPEEWCRPGPYPPQQYMSPMGLRPAQRGEPGEPELQSPFFLSPNQLPSEVTEIA